MENQNGAEPPKRIKHSCKGCEDRYVGCHSECEPYLKYKESLAIYNAYVSKVKKERDEMYAYKSDGAIKTLRKKGRLK